MPFVVGVGQNPSQTDLLRGSAQNMNLQNEAFRRVTKANPSSG